MSETFWLWHHHYDAKARTYTFFATAVNVQGLNRGTDKMVKQMLKDIGLDIAPRKWTLKLTATDYISDADAGEAIEDQWMVTGELILEVDSPVHVDLPPPGIAMTTAWDDTWRVGEATTPSLLVVADFRRETTADKAADALARLASGATADALTEAVHEGFPRIAKKNLEEVGLEAGWDFDVDTCSEARQLHLKLPTKTSSLKEAAAIAAKLEAVIQLMGGTVRWRDRYLT